MPLCKAYKRKSPISTAQAEDWCVIWRHSRAFEVVLTHAWLYWRHGGAVILIYNYLWVAAVYIRKYKLQSWRFVRSHVNGWQSISVEAICEPEFEQFQDVCYFAEQSRPRKFEGISCGSRWWQGLCQAIVVVRGEFLRDGIIHNITASSFEQQFFGLKIITRHSWYADPIGLVGSWEWIIPQVYEGKAIWLSCWGHCPELDVMTEVDCHLQIWRLQLRPTTGEQNIKMWWFGVVLLSHDAFNETDALHWGTWPVDRQILLVHRALLISIYQYQALVPELHKAVKGIA